MLTESYRNSLIAQMEAIKGSKAMYFKNLVTGETFGYNEDQSLQPASVIKLAIFMRYLQLASEGKIDPKEEIIYGDEDRLGGCGALKAFRGTQKVSIETLWELMITISDNSATNLLIKRLGREQLVEDFKAMGLKVTKLNRLFFDSEAAARGIENEISAREMGELLEKIYRREWVNEEVSAYAEKVLLDQQVNHKIPGYLEGSIAVAHKTGEDDGISNDVGIVYAKEPFILCFVSTYTDVPAWERFMRQTALELTELCGGKPEARG